MPTAVWETVQDMMATLRTFMQAQAAGSSAPPTGATPPPVSDPLPAPAPPPVPREAPPAVIDPTSAPIQTVPPPVDSPQPPIPGPDTRPVERVDSGARSEDGHERTAQELSEWLRIARNLGCWTFAGTDDAQQARAWIEFVEDTLMDMKLKDEDKLCVATRLFEASARAWWAKLKKKAATPITWSQFREQFDAQYYTPYQQDQKQEAFLECKQGNRTVKEYEAEFTELASFVPELIPSEWYLCKRFVKGLHFDIRKGVNITRSHTFSDVLELALSVEEAVVEERSRLAARKRGSESFAQDFQRQTRPSRFSGGTGTGTFPRPFSPQQARSQTVPTYSQTSIRPPVRSCASCRRVHMGPCPAPRRCYQCGQTGHLRAQCPQLIAESSAGSRGTGLLPTPSRAPSGAPGSAAPSPIPLARAAPSTSQISHRPQTRLQTRVFALTNEDANQNPDVVTGTPSPIS